MRKTLLFSSRLSKLQNLMYRKLLSTQCHVAIGCSINHLTLWSHKHAIFDDLNAEWNSAHIRAEEMRFSRQWILAPPGKTGIKTPRCSQHPSSFSFKISTIAKIYREAFKFGKILTFEEMHWALRPGGSTRNLKKCFTSCDYVYRHILWWQALLAV